MNSGQTPFSPGSDGKPNILDQCNFHYRTTSYDEHNLQPTYVKIRYEGGHVDSGMNSALTSQLVVTPLRSELDARW